MRNLFLTFSSLILAASVLNLSAPPICQAGLGEPAASIVKDEKALAVKKKSVQNFSAYTVHEIKNNTLTIRQYVTPSNVVFAIAWSGLMQPDLDELLGAYAPEYKKTTRQLKRQPGRRYFKAATGNVVVEKWGHLRKMQGRAYLPALIPDGVAVDEIR